jgi:inorganic pyrophosphatase
VEAEQTEDGKTIRNDRLIAVPELQFGPHMARSLKELGEERIREIERLFVSYNREEGREFKPIGRHGPKRAAKLIEEGGRRFREEG